MGNDANDLPMFENAQHTVMIGHHEELSRYAKDTIGLEGNYEQAIIEKITQLSGE